MSQNGSHEWSTVRGTQCIVWKYKQNSTKAKKNLMKKEKDQLGRENLNIPILDTRYSSNRKEICNILIYSDNLDQWERAVEVQYGDRVLPRKNIHYGYQRIITRESGDDVFLVLTFYKTQKFMIQPGDQEEQHILIIPKRLHKIKAAYSS